MIDPIPGSLTVELTFFLGDGRRVDADNLSKCVMDGLNGIVWEDDRQNIRLVIDKYICRRRQGVLVKVLPNDRALEISEEELSNKIA